MVEGLSLLFGLLSMLGLGLANILAKPLSIELGPARTTLYLRVSEASGMK
jgi:hypothetical protein